MADVADELVLEVDDLLPLIDALEPLGFADVVDAQVVLTSRGVTFAGADIQASKRIFAAEARARVPLVGLITNSLARTDDGTLRRGFFLDVLRRHFSREEASAQLGIAIDWGRYGELDEYDADHDVIRLESDT
ncbi:MAG: AAA-associated domain-containing protein [Acidimicrobiales bacterium]